MNGSNGNATNGARHKVPVPLLIMATLIVISLGWYFLNLPREDRSVLSVSGRIEGYETDVGAKIGGRVESIRFREGELVKDGELVAKLTDDDIQAQLRQAEAKAEAASSIVKQRENALDVIRWQIKQAQLQVSQSKEDVTAQIEQNEANVAQTSAELIEAKARLTEAISSLELAGKRKKRYEKLIGPGAVTKDEYDEIMTNYQTALATVDSRKALVESAEKKLTAAGALLNQAKATRFTPNIRTSQLFATRQQLAEAEQQLESARADATAAREQVEEIKAQIAYLNLRSPIEGVVTARPIEPGAVVVAGETVLSLIDLDKVYLRAYVPEGDIGRVRLGQKCRVYLDSFPDRPFDGSVIQIDPIASFTPENIYFKDDRVRQVFGIKIGISKPDGFAKPGMPADAEIITDVPSQSGER